jgi:pyridoxal phosphate enzyme (YggS family)
VSEPPPVEAAEGRLRRIRARIAEAAGVARRTPEDVTLVAVSKTFEAPAIRPFLEAGHRVFGENRVQEAARKWPALRAAFPDLRLHLIGPLQTNKTREAVELFDVVETVDRDRLAAALAAEIARAGRAPKLHVQVNTGLEPQKAGVAPAEAVAFVARCREAHGLAIDGLMCIPPADQPPGPHFALLDELAKAAGVAARSMGMSADFEEAIWNGATHVRIGSALFGERASPDPDARARADAGQRA